MSGFGKTFHQPVYGGPDCQSVPPAITRIELGRGRLAAFISLKNFSRSSLTHHAEKRREKHDDAGTVKEIADNADTKELFVRQNIPGGFRGIVRDDQTVVNAKIDADHDREGGQVGKSRDSCRFTLRLVDRADEHLCSPKGALRAVGINERKMPG